MNHTSKELEKKLAEGWKEGRITSLGDNVFGFAMTILILNLVIPPDLPSESLGHLFLTWWPQFMTYFMSFVVLGVLWVGHHNIMGLVRHVDRKSVWINILFMSFVVLIPFTTAILRLYYAEQVAITAYGLNLIVCGIILMWFFNYAIGENLIENDVTESMVSVMKLRILIPTAGCVLVTLFAFISPTASLFMFAGLFLLVAIPTNSDVIASFLTGIPAGKR